MTGIFGFLGTDLPSAERARSAFESIRPGGEVIEVTGGFFRVSSRPGAVGYRWLGGDLHIVDGSASAYREFMAAKDGSELLDLEGVPRFTGNLISYSSVRRELQIASEWTGTFPLYYLPTRAGLAFSNHLRPLGNLVGRSVSPEGLIAFLLAAYTCAGRSLFEGISRIQAGQRVRVSADGTPIAITETSRLWAESDFAKGSSESEAVDATKALLESAVKREANGSSTALMASAGWDSRTLLGVLRGLRGGPAPVGYSHGDLASRELLITHNLVISSGLKHLTQALNPAMYQVAFIQKAMDSTENVIFPHWHWAGDRLAEHGIEQAMAGVYGEVMGGHYGRTMLLGGWRKVLAVGSGLLRAPGRASALSNEDVSEIRSFLRRGVLRRPWYLDADYWESLGRVGERLNADIDADISRLLNRGVNHPDALIEAFVSEHRGAQYINAQLLSCRGGTAVSFPFADRELLLYSTTLPLGYRLHNRLNQGILRRIAPDLLRRPLAATLLPAGSPILLQEGSRAARRLGERTVRILHRAFPSFIGLPRLTWANFEFLRHSECLEDVVDSLKQPVWDKVRLKGLLSDARRTGSTVEMHPISDQLMKIVTADRALSA